MSVEGILSVAQAFTAWLVAHPTEAGAVSLGAALVLDWAFGVLLAVAERRFEWTYLPNVLASQLATREMAGIVGLLMAAYVAHSADPAIYPYLVAAVGAAATLYSAPTWVDVAAKVRAILSIALTAVFGPVAAPAISEALVREAEAIIAGYAAQMAERARARLPEYGVPPAVVSHRDIGPPTPPASPAP